MGSLIINSQLPRNYPTITQPLPKLPTILFLDRWTIWSPIFAASFFAVIMSYDRQLGLTPNLAPVIVKFS